MRAKRILFAAASLTLAAVLMGLGLLRVFRVYQHYRTDILANESRHLDSIVGANAGGFGWMLYGYDGQLGMLTDRIEFAAAEDSYARSGDPSVFRSLMARRDVLRMDQPYIVAVWNGEMLLGVTGPDFPTQTGDDEQLGSLCSIREDGAGRFWFIFTRERESGLRYEMAVQVQTLFSNQAQAARVGRSGYFFLLDGEKRFMCYASDGISEIADVDSLLERYAGADGSVLDSMLSDAKREYYVFRIPWPDAAEETLVVTSRLANGAEGLLVGAAMSFSEFDSFLSDTLREVAWIILLEIGGALILVTMAGALLIQNRRSVLELAVVRERADLMEEINRQQQSLYHTERLQQLGVMTGGMVHEFNNMLTPIMGQSMLLLEQLADRADSEEFEYALDVYEASEKARDVLKRMSAMGKKDADLGFRTLDIGALLQKTVNLSSMAKDSHIQQVLDLPPEPLFVEGSEQLLTQAFLNLCMNACQAMESEGTLTVSARRETISGREYAVVRVSDTGPGIPEDALGSIYDAFFTTKGERGTGLGLAICKKIIETHKGTIQAANREACGAEFTVRIPAYKLPD